MLLRYNFYIVQILYRVICTDHTDLFCIVIKVEEHAEDYLRELEVLQKRVPELEDENEKFRAEGTHVCLIS